MPEGSGEGQMQHTGAARRAANPVCVEQLRTRAIVASEATPDLCNNGGINIARVSINRRQQAAAPRQR